jgi:uncharacterized protein YggU (UPF0235/DUF167 family)
MAGRAQCGDGTLARVKLEIQVRPNSSKAAVGGCYDGALIVRVREPADGGRATRAALVAVAGALGLPRSVVTLDRGPTSRRKLIDIAVDDDAHLCIRVGHLLAQG